MLFFHVQVLDRPDIAEAAGADGVLLSADGLPTVVARRALAESAGLLGRRAESADAVARASAEGADFVLAAEPTALRAARPRASVPLLADLLPSTSPQAAAIGDPSFRRLLADFGDAGADGALLPSILTTKAASGIATALAAVREQWRPANGVSATDAAILAPASAQDFAERAPAQPIPLEAAPEAPPADVAAVATPAADAVALATPAADAAEDPPATPARILPAGPADEVLEEERALLTRVLALLEAAAPEVEEASLLRDELAELDGHFLLVVVGEFNSGKSSVINALLGARYLREGVLPTTNEITVLRYGSGSGGSGGSSSSSAGRSGSGDAYFEAELPAPLLREVAIVDTPGTNVILRRQQRLTEEFVPRADLVLFVMSADRPFTDSEERFLQYIRQWGKKIVFVLNKVDALQGAGELEQVVGFVADNAQRLLGLAGPGACRVLPVSARAAMEAKMAATPPPQRGGLLSGVGLGGSGDGATLELDSAALARDPRWTKSGFAAFESFIFDFLRGNGGGTGNEVRHHCASRP